MSLLFSLFIPWDFFPECSLGFFYWGFIKVVCFYAGRFLKGFLRLLLIRNRYENRYPYVPLILEERGWGGAKIQRGDDVFVCI